MLQDAIPLIAGASAFVLVYKLLSGKKVPRSRIKSLYENRKASKYENALIDVEEIKSGEWTEIDFRSNDISVDVLASDFKYSSSPYQAFVNNERIAIIFFNSFLKTYGKVYDLKDIKEFMLVSNDNRRGLGNVLLWGAAGGLVAGPLGAVGLGALSNYKKDYCQFVLTFNDGRRILCELKSKYYAKFSFYLKPHMS